MFTISTANEYERWPAPHPLPHPSTAWPLYCSRIEKAKPNINSSFLLELELSLVRAMLMVSARLDNMISHEHVPSSISTRLAFPYMTTPS